MINFIKKTAFIFGFITLFTSCSEDENDSCYTCETTQTEYCYTVGNTYYLTTDADGATHQTELNGASWSDTQDSLENQCNGNSEDFDILGTWNLTDLNGTSSSVTTYTGSTMTITIDSETTLVTTDATVTYLSDGTYVATGASEIRVVSTSGGQVVSDTTQTSTPQDSGTWVIDGDQITFNANTSQEAVGTIISQSSNSFTFKSVIYRSDDNDSGNTTTNGEFFQTYTKQ